jgi:hypothetical protein
MITVAFLLVGAIATGVGSWLWINAHRAQGRTGIAITVTALGVALILLADGVQDLESHLYPSLGRLASNLATLVAAYGITVVVTDLAEDTTGAHTHRRLRRWLLGIALLILAASFFATPHLPTGVGVFGDLYHQEPTLVVYSVGYVLYLGAAVTDIAILAARTLPATRGYLRAGLVILILACLLAGAYLVQRIVTVALSVFASVPAEPLCAGPFSSVDCTFSVGFPALSVLLIVLAVLVPAAGGRLHRALTGQRDRQWIARLRPLSDAVIAALPQLDRTGGGAAGRPREQLVTIVMQIRDALLLLGLPHRPADDPADIARDLRDALARPDDLPAAPDTAPTPGPAANQPGDLGAEVERLLLVARAYDPVNEAAS